jgi:D-amino-acid dehydrogenase
MKEMKQQADVLVIGGGVIGVCAAYYLAERGRQVTLVEQGEICAGCSYGNAGLIVPSHSIPLAAPGVWLKGLKWLFNPESPFYIKPRLDFALFSWLWKFRAACNEQRMRQAIPLLRDLSRASIELYDQLSTRKGLEFGYQRNGVLMLFRSEQGYKEGLEEAHLLREMGIELNVLSATEVQEHEPNVATQITGGIYFAEDAQLIPAAFVQGLAHVVEKMGVHIHTATEVIGFGTADRRIATVQTTRGDFQPQQVILAGGSWSPLLARALHITLPIQPAKGYSITFTRPAMSPSIPLLLSEAKMAITPMGETLRFGGTLELAGLDFSINRRRVDAVVRAAHEYLPSSIKDLTLIEIWRGLRPCTPDGLPILGRFSAYDNLVVAAGHAMIGMSLGPITGKLVAQLVCNEPPALDLTPLSGERFR